MKRESRTVDRSHQGDSPTQRHLPLVDLLVDTRAELMELAVTSGLQVLTTILEEDRTAICGPRYQHQVDRAATRTGTAPSEGHCQLGLLLAELPYAQLPRIPVFP